MACKYGRRCNSNPADQHGHRCSDRKLPKTRWGTPPWVSPSEKPLLVETTRGRARLCGQATAQKAPTLRRSVIRPARTGEVENPNLVLARLRLSSAVSAEPQSLGSDWVVTLVPPQVLAPSSRARQQASVGDARAAINFPQLFSFRSQFSAPY